MIVDSEALPDGVAGNRSSLPPGSADELVQLAELLESNNELQSIIPSDCTAERTLSREACGNACEPTPGELGLLSCGNSTMYAACIVHYTGFANCNQKKLF